MQEGIDFKEGSRGGVVRNNLVSAVRSAGIYADEGSGDVYQNVVRWVGRYDPEDGSGLQQACEYYKTRGVALQCFSSGIQINAGDLQGGVETGRESGVRIFQNVVHDIWRFAFAVANNYRVGQKQPYWLLDNLTVFNNVFYAAGERDGYNVMVDVGATHVTLANNVVARGHGGGVTVSTVGSNASTRDAFYASANNTRNLFWRKRVDHGSNARPSSPPPARD